MLTTLEAQIKRLGPRGWFAVLTIVAAVRAPHVLLNGRFWAEEGTIHFAHAFIEGGIDGLTFIDQRAGYLNIVPNVGTWLASLVPLSVAPLVTTWMAFLIIVGLLWVTLAWQSELLPTPTARVVAAALLLVGPAAHPEVWSNTINSQTYLGILGLVLVFARLDRLSHRQFAVSVAALSCAALAGLYTAVLTPLFWWQAYRDRTRRRLVHAAVISSATAFQAFIVLLSRTSGSLEETKLTLPGPAELFATVGTLHVTPIVLGRSVSADLADKILVGRGIAWVLAVGVIGVIVAGAIAVAVRSGSRHVLFVLGTAFALTEVLVQLGAWGIADSRYAVLPLAITSLLLAHGLATAESPMSRTVVVALITIALVVGAAEFWTEKRLALDCVGCPDWQAEIEAWEADPSDGLEIWPYPPWPYAPWTVDLPAE